jgi:hypothetical protein
MSGADSLLERLRRAYSAIAEVEATARLFPHDTFIRANLDALKHDASDIETAWERECLERHLEICRYRLLPDVGNRYTITSVTKSLLDFQELFSQLFDTLKHGLKQRARISGRVLSETEFDFGFSYPGSLGIAMTAKSSSDLFRAGKFDATVDAFMRVLSVSDEVGVKGLANEMGDAVVKKVYDWASINALSRYSLDITWTTVAGTKKGGYVGSETLGRVADIIRRTSDKEHREFETTGILVAINTIGRRFRFVEPAGEDFSGLIDEGFPLHQQWTVNKAYTAKMSVDAVTEYATQKTEQTYKLLSLEPFEISE